MMIISMRCPKPYSKTLRFMLEAGADASFGDMCDDEDCHRALTAACDNGHVENVRYSWELGLTQTQQAASATCRLLITPSVAPTLRSPACW